MCVHVHMCHIREKELIRLVHCGKDGSPCTAVRYPVEGSWCELMEVMSSIQGGAPHVILARAGRPHVPEKVRPLPLPHPQQGLLCSRVL